MAACIDGLKDTCLHNQTRQETSEPLAGEVQRLKATERDYCSHGMLSRQSNQRIDGCKKKFYKKVAKCEKKFHGIFNKRLSDSVDLCRYVTGREAVESADALKSRNDSSILA